MAHPYASQAKSSEKSRLARLTGKPGKSWGSSNMYKKSSYPSKNAGSSTPMTISGGTAKKRADRFANGGQVGGKKRKGGTTNITIVSPPAGGGPRPVPVPVPRPVPVPVRPPMGLRPPGAPAPAAPPGGAMAAGPGAGAPVNVNVPPPAPAAMPRPGMADGGYLRSSSYHNWGEGYKSGGAVKKNSRGFMKDPTPNGYKGYPHSPTTQVEAVSPKKDGGGIKKKQFGGGLGGMPGAGPARGRRRAGGAPPPGAARVAATPAGGAPPPGLARAAATPGGGPPIVPLTGGRPRANQGIGMPGMKDGGHADEAEDKKLIKKMLRQEEKAEKKASGGKVRKYQGGGNIMDQIQDAAQDAEDEGGFSFSKIGKGLGELGKTLGGGQSSSSGGGSKFDPSKSAADAGAAAGKATQSLLNMQPPRMGSVKLGQAPGEQPSGKFQLKGGGRVKAAPSSGLGRLKRIPAAKAVPAKTEI